MARGKMPRHARVLPRDEEILRVLGRGGEPGGLKGAGGIAVWNGGGRDSWGDSNGEV